MSISLDQIFNADLNELMNVVGRNLFPTYTLQDINSNLDEVYNAYRIEVIRGYLHNRWLDNQSSNVASNLHFFPSMIPSNNSLDKVLQSMEQKSHRASPQRGSEYYPSTTLSDTDQKYCRALTHIAAKQSEECLMNREWGRKDSQGKVCYNVYAVAHKSVPGVGRPHCLKDLNLDALSEEELLGQAHLHGIKTIDELRQKQRNERDQV